MLRKITFPQWLNGQTIAMLTLVAAFAAITQAGFTDMRSEMRQMRNEVSSEFVQVRGEIGQLRTEMGQLRNEMRDEIGQLRTEVRSDLGQVKDRLRNVELEVASIKAGMAPAPGTGEIAAR